MARRPRSCRDVHGRDRGGVRATSTADRSGEHPGPLLESLRKSDSCAAVAGELRSLAEGVFTLNAGNIRVSRPVAQSRWVAKSLSLIHIVLIPLLVAAMTLYVYRASLGA